MSYNVFSGSSRGPDIFGTEPWHFYIRNLLLNFNLWFLLAMCSGPLLVLQLIPHGGIASRASIVKSVGLITPFYLWLAIFSAQAHKEERFMYPAYPFLCFNAAFALHNLLYYFGRPNSITRMIPAKLRLFITFCSVLLITVVGVLRTLGTVSAYGAPLEIYSPLQDQPYADMEGNVCLGKEWYRFPSSYFLPRKMRAKFIKSAFDGLLPGQFSEAKTTLGLPPTWLIPPGMNDQNIEDPGKHVPNQSCLFRLDDTDERRSTLVYACSSSIYTFHNRSLQRGNLISRLTRPIGRNCGVPASSTLRARTFGAGSSSYLIGILYPRDIDEDGDIIAYCGANLPPFELLDISNSSI